MTNQFHERLVDDDIHALTAKTFTNIANRDADTDFQVTANINKMVRIDSPASYYILTSIGPAVWSEASNTASDEFIDLTDTPSSYSGAEGDLVQVTAGGTALEFSDSPLMVNPTISADLLVGGSRPIVTDVSLELKATDKALLLNRLTTTQRDAISSPVFPMTIGNTTTGNVEFYDGATWQPMGGGDVVGPASSTDDAIVRFNLATGKLLQNSLVTIGDTGIISK